MSQQGQNSDSVKWTRYLLSDPASAAFSCSENLSLPKIAEESLFPEVHSLPSVAVPALAAKFLPLEWILDPDKKGSKADRILARIVQAEAHESNVWRKDDYRQTFVCVSLAAKGNLIPFIESSYICYGLHPDKVWPSIVARRKADLGKLYGQFYDANDLALPSPTSPKICGDAHAAQRQAHDSNQAQTADSHSPDQRTGLRLGSDDDVRQKPPIAQPVRGGQLSDDHQRLECKTLALSSESARSSTVGNQSGPQIAPSPKKPSQSVRPKKEEKIA